MYHQCHVIQFILKGAVKDSRPPHSFPYPLNFIRYEDKCGLVAKEIKGLLIIRHRAERVYMRGTDVITPSHVDGDRRSWHILQKMPGVGGILRRQTKFGT